MTHAAPPPPLSPPLFCLQLQPGHRVWEYLPRAADITVTAGSIVVHQRLVLAGSWVHLPVVVRAGERFRVAAAGWVEMEAKGAARVYGSVAPTWWQRAWFCLGLRRGSLTWAKDEQTKELPAL